jgi:hypothetical protein
VKIKLTPYSKLVLEVRIWNLMGLSHWSEKNSSTKKGSGLREGSTKVASHSLGLSPLSPPTAANSAPARPNFCPQIAGRSGGQPADRPLQVDGDRGVRVDSTHRGRRHQFGAVQRGGRRSDGQGCARKEGPPGSPFYSRCRGSTSRPWLPPSKHRYTSSCIVPLSFRFC